MDEGGVRKIKVYVVLYIDVWARLYAKLHISIVELYIRMYVCMYASHSPHVFIHRVAHPNVLFIHRHRHDNFQGLRLVSHRLHRSHMHKNAHRKLYLKEKAKKKKEENEPSGMKA